MYPMQTKPKPRAADAQPTMFVRMAAVVRMTGLGRSTIYRLMAENKFPSPVRLAKRAVGWRRIDLDQWSAGRPTVSHSCGRAEPRTDGRVGLRRHRELQNRTDQQHRRQDLAPAPGGKPIAMVHPEGAMQSPQAE